MLDFSSFSWGLMVCQCEIFLVSTSSPHNNKGGCSRDAQGSADLPQCRRGAVSPSPISVLIHFAHDRKQDSANTRAYSYEHTQSKRRIFVQLSRQFDCLVHVQQDAIYDPLRVHTSVLLRYHSITSASSIQPISTSYPISSFPTYLPPRYS